MYGRLLPTVLNRYVQRPAMTTYVSSLSLKFGRDLCACAGFQGQIEGTDRPRFGHEFLDTSQAEAKPEISPNAGHDYGWFKPPLAEDF